MTAPTTLWLRRLVSPRRPPAPDRGGVPAAGPCAATECERGRGLSALAGTPTMSGLSIMASHRPGGTEPPALALLALG